MDKRISLISLFDCSTLCYTQDNQSAIRLVIGGVCHKRSKHFGIEFDFLQEQHEEGEFVVKYKPTKELAADMLTKTLPPSSFIPHREDNGKFQKTEIFCRLKNQGNPQR